MMTGPPARPARSRPTAVARAARAHRSPRRVCSVTPSTCSAPTTRSLRLKRNSTFSRLLRSRAAAGHVGLIAR